MPEYDKKDRDCGLKRIVFKPFHLEGEVKGK
jgi:hypothetical protein